MSIFRYFLFFLAQKKTWNYTLVDDCILLFTQEVYKVVAVWYRRNKWFITNWYDIFCTHTWDFLDETYRHKLRHLLLGVSRMVLLKFENIKRDGWSWWKLIQIRLLCSYLIFHMKWSGLQVFCLLFRNS